MKTLILVLSAMRDPWDKMLTTSKETWDAPDETRYDTDVLYYCGKSNLPATDRVFFSPNHDEELERVTARTLEAFEHSLNWDWQYMARCHSSTYVHKRNLAKYCETLPSKDVLEGLMTSGERPFLWGGGHYIISRDVIEKFVQNKGIWDMNVMEDVSMTRAAEKLGIPISPGKSATICLEDWTIEGKKLCLCYNLAETFEFTDWADIMKAYPNYFFRCKQDLKRYLDLEIFRKLKEYYV